MMRTYYGIKPVPKARQPIPAPRPTEADPGKVIQAMFVGHITETRRICVFEKAPNKPRKPLAVGKRFDELHDRLEEFQKLKSVLDVNVHDEGRWKGCDPKKFLEALRRLPRQLAAV